MDLETFPDAQAVAAKAADRVVELLQVHPEPVVLIPAGATPIPTYAELARRTTAGDLNPRAAHWVQLDELQGVAPGDARSFHHFLEQHVAIPMGIAQRLHRIDGCATEPETEIANHANQLARLGGTHLALLGLGPNGHVAFNEPGTHAQAPARVVPLASETSTGLRSAFPEGAPTHGLTLGLREIRAAREIVLLVTGSSKAQALARLVRGSPAEDFPASLLLEHPRLRVLADAAACALL